MWLISSEASCLSRVVLPPLSNPRSKMRTSWSGVLFSFRKIDSKPWNNTVVLDWLGYTNAVYMNVALRAARVNTSSAIKLINPIYPSTTIHLSSLGNDQHTNCTITICISCFHFSIMITSHSSLALDLKHTGLLKHLFRWIMMMLYC